MTKYPGYEHVRQILREHYAGGKVLDIGAGPATYRDLFEDYVGIDLPTTGYEGTLEAYCDARSLCFRPGTFDLAFTQASLYLIGNPEYVCQEVWMALKEN
ncbi:MAG: class I SAM-dependent methyltransferase, partial [bacterium]